MLNVCFDVFCFVILELMSQGNRMIPDLNRHYLKFQFEAGGHWQQAIAIMDALLEMKASREFLAVFTP